MEHGCHVFAALQDPLTGDIITDHRAIARRYLTGWFAIDLLATFPVDYIVRGLEVRLRVSLFASVASCHRSRVAAVACRKGWLPGWRPQVPFSYQPQGSSLTCTAGATRWTLSRPAAEVHGPTTHGYVLAIVFKQRWRSPQ